MLAAVAMAAAVYPPEFFHGRQTAKATPDDPRAGVPALPCFGWPAL